MSHPFPSTQELCIDWPLYKEFDYDDYHQEALYSFFCTESQIDCYCPQCGSDTVLRDGKITASRPGWYGEFPISYTRCLTKKYQCSRSPEHEFFFIYVMDGSKLAKVGQAPSKADLDLAKIKSYKSVLDNDLYRELSKSIGLVSHGVGIGSFVYLRRIFERLIEEAHQQEALRVDWDEEGYRLSPVSEKIQILAHVLPAFLVKQRKLYSILSKGIHELSEDECLAYHPVVQTGIELILDQKLALDAQAKKLKKAENDLNKIMSGL